MPKSVNTEAADVAATIAALREQAEARARAMGVTAQGALDDPLQQAADLARISAHFPIMWRLPVVGRGLSLAKRAARIGLRWYINPIVDQINDFNAATITALNTLAARQEALAARVAALEAAPTPAPPPQAGEGGLGSACVATIEQPSTVDEAHSRQDETPLSRSAGEGRGWGPMGAVP